jgi:outer membrane receptor for Fe3+-dicitrate
VKFFVYFDAYGNARQVIDQKKLAQKYNNNPDEFLQDMCRTCPGVEVNHTSGHVGTLRCRSESRPYNF